MAISVTVPKDLSAIKTKVAFNLTKRQLVCFSAAALVGMPFYVFTKDLLGTEVSALFMVVLMLPFFFLAMYERDGFPAEKIVYFMVRQKFLVPGIRPYRTENLYSRLEEREKLRKELAYLESREESYKSRKQAVHKGKKALKGTAPDTVRGKKKKENTTYSTGKHNI